MAPQLSHKEKQGKTPSKTRGSDWTRRPLCPRSLVDRRNSQRPPQVTSTLVVTWLGDPRWTLSSSSTDCGDSRLERSYPQLHTPIPPPTDCSTQTETSTDRPTSPRGRSACPFYPPWLLAPPCFQLPQEVSRRGAFSTSNALTPPLAARGGRRNRCGGPLGACGPGRFITQNQTPPLHHL